jgi:type IV pilus assembly protein PilE
VSRGFTFLELLVVVAIAGILLALAVPSYQRQVQRSHRADAIRAMLSIAACLERSRAGSGFYDTAACITAAPSEHYALHIEPHGIKDAVKYRIIAEPLNGGDSCGSLSLDQAGGHGISGAEDRLAACWSGR